MKKSARNRELNKQYLQEKLDPILQKMVLALLVKKPEKVEEFLIDWLKERINKQDESNSEQQQSEQMIDYSDKSSQENSNNDSEEEDDYLEIENLMKTKSKNPQIRKSVSAEVFGFYNKRQSYKPKVVPKTADQKKRIAERLGQVFMFSSLSQKEKEIVINAMEERKYNQGDKVITQGEDGDVLFVVDTGELDCFKEFKDSSEQKYLKTYKAGELFGELALLYNAPRAATIKAKTNAVCFTLDRDCFNNIVKDATIQRREKYEKFLKEAEFLSTMDPYERTQLIDAFKNVEFQTGEYVLKQGDEGYDFYIVEEGELIATVEIDGEQKTVYEYNKPGEYFGELALLDNIARQASVKCITVAKLLKLDKQTFKRLLGPLETIMKRNKDKYEKVLADIKQEKRFPSKQE